MPPAERLLDQKPFGSFEVRLYGYLDDDNEPSRWVLRARFSNGYERQIGNTEWKENKARFMFNKIDANIAKKLLEMWSYYAKYWNIQVEVNQLLREGFYHGNSSIRQDWNQILNTINGDNIIVHDTVQQSTSLASGDSKRQRAIEARQELREKKARDHPEDESKIIDGVRVYTKKVLHPLWTGANNSMQEKYGQFMYVIESNITKVELIEEKIGNDNQRFSLWKIVFTTKSGDSRTETQSRFEAAMERAEHIVVVLSK